VFESVQIAADHGYIPVDCLFIKRKGHKALQEALDEGATDFDMVLGNGSVLFVIGTGDALKLNELLMSRPEIDEESKANRKKLSCYLRADNVEPILRLRSDLESNRIAL